VGCFVDIQREGSFEDSKIIFEFRNYGVWTAKNVKMTVAITLQDERTITWSKFENYDIGNVKALSSKSRGISFSEFFDLAEFTTLIKEVKVKSTWSDSSTRGKSTTVSKFSDSSENPENDLLGIYSTRELLAPVLFLLLDLFAISILLYILFVRIVISDY
jgi:hypothetical protein